MSIGWVADASLPRSDKILQWDNMPGGADAGKSRARTQSQGSLVRLADLCYGAVADMDAVVSGSEIHFTGVHVGCFLKLLRTALRTREHEREVLDQVKVLWEKHFVTAGVAGLKGGPHSAQKMLYS